MITLKDIPEGYAIVRIKWPDSESPANIKFRMFHGLRNWLISIGENPNERFYWENSSGAYFPSHIILDRESAVLFTLAQ